jgi:DNA-binding FadR family transcriptional regulator
MGLLSTLARYVDTLPSGFVTHLMAVRSRLLPIIATLAVDQAPDDVRTFLEGAGQLDDDITAFVDFDWQLQLFLATKSGNPIYRLMLNDFSTMFEPCNRLFFPFRSTDRIPTLLPGSLYGHTGGGDRVETVVKAAMNHSVALWQRLNAG